MCIIMVLFKFCYTLYQLWRYPRIFHLKSYVKLLTMVVLGLIIALFFATPINIFALPYQTEEDVTVIYQPMDVVDLINHQFVHTVTAANSTNNYTELDDPLINNDPNAIVLVTPRYNPTGTVRLYSAQSIGVFYNGLTGKWVVFNQDESKSMVQGANFNIFIPLEDDPSVFVHSATAANSNGNYTEIDHPQLNDNPEAVLHITPKGDLDDSESAYNNHAVGVSYIEMAGKWAIFNQDVIDMAHGSSFNVMIATEDPETETEIFIFNGPPIIIKKIHPTVFVHTALADNTSAYFTELDHELINGNPDAIVHVSQSWNTENIAGTESDYAIGVWYNAASERWNIFNQDIRDMLVETDFNVIVSANRAPLSEIHLPLIAN